MWNNPVKIINSPDTQIATSLSPIKSGEPVTIDTVIEINNSFWKTMHPDFQKVYDAGQKLSKLDDSSDAAVIKSFIQTINVFYKNQILQSTLTLEQKEEEIKKINLLEVQADLIEQTIKTLKNPVDKSIIFAYILGYNVNLYKRNKDN